MKQQVHGTNAKHRLVGIETVYHVGLDVLHLVLRKQSLLVLFLDIFHGLNEKTGATHGWVADIILWGRLHHLHDHTDDMARRAELSVRAGSSHLAKDVLIYVTHGITVVHVKGINAVNDLREGTGVRDEEYRRLHITAISTLFACSDMLDELENTLSHNLEHIVRTEVLEHVPTEMLVRYSGLLFFGSSFRVHPSLTGRESRILNLSIPVAGIRLLLQLLVIEHLHKEDIRHLFQYRYRIGDTSHEERIPYLVDFVFYIACDHILFFSLILFITQELIDRFTSRVESNSIREHFVCSFSLYLQNYNFLL